MMKKLLDIVVVLIVLVVIVASVGARDTKRASLGMSIARITITSAPSTAAETPLPRRSMLLVEFFAGY